MSTLTPEQVFVTDGFPELTYVRQEEGRPERELQEGLDQQNKIISIVGASKTGKSTLCDKRFGKKLGVNKILVTGDQIPDVY
jgi:predicted GTPase